MNRRVIGRREFGRATAGAGPLATGRVREASPVLAAGVEEFIFADVFSRSGLPARERELLTVAVLAALGGADNQLAVHAPAALECGADPEELLQLCEQIAPYAGFPRALNAVRAVRAVLEERGLPLPIAAVDVELGDHATLALHAGAGDEGTLLVHSPELDRRMWRDLIRALPEGSHVVAPDLRGAGAAVGAPPPADAAAVAADLIGVMDAVGMRTAHVVTQGASAAAADALVEGWPGRIGAVTLFGPSPAVPGAPPGRRVLADQLRAESLAVDGWAVRYARDRLARLDHDGWSALTAALARGRVSCSGARVLRIVVGEDDRGTGAAAAGGWPQAARVRVPGASHLVPLEAPEACAALVGAPA